VEYLAGSWFWGGTGSTGRDIDHIHKMKIWKKILDSYLTVSLIAVVVGASKNR
jgi:hypothetical protein